MEAPVFLEEPDGGGHNPARHGQDAHATAFFKGLARRARGFRGEKEISAGGAMRVWDVEPENGF